MHTHKYINTCVYIYIYICAHTTRQMLKIPFVGVLNKSNHKKHIYSGIDSTDPTVLFWKAKIFNLLYTFSGLLC